MAFSFLKNTKSFVHLSPIPLKAKEGEGCILGVDEAGRGPVLGPMVYSACYHIPGMEDDFKDLGFDDSKVLNEIQRESLFEKINQNSDRIGYAIHSLSPSYISSCMLGKEKYNLNALAHDTTINLIKRLLEEGVKIKEIYVDTVGIPEKYEAKLNSHFPYIRIKVSKKADSLYPSVSAASICAKVTRDSVLKNWDFNELDALSLKPSREFGSGYTSDVNTVNWLNNNIDPLFGWPSIIRFSWSTCERLLEDKGIQVRW
ncbi:ribonuclease-like protein H2 large subunit [Neoconidiobolus thromboides FSU 785]|nr:ribonuclease-like protein H2 large subunit [Neoconidiobolus thromboides FSU 785]